MVLICMTTIDIKFTHIECLYQDIEQFDDDGPFRFEAGLIVVAIAIEPAACRLGFVATGRCRLYSNSCS